MARPAKHYQIRVRGAQRSDIDADLLLQALLLMAEEIEQVSSERNLAPTNTSAVSTAVRGDRI